jgi:hypothetical protein
LRRTTDTLRIEDITMNRDLEALLAERAITAVMNAYCHAMDSGRAREWLDCFTVDARFEVSLPGGETYVRLAGEAELARFAAGLRDQPGQKHVYTTPVFGVDLDAGEAEVSSYFLMLSGDGRSSGVSSFGRTWDRFVRHDGRWKICERRISTDGMKPAAP